MTTEPTRLSRIWRATETTLDSGVAVTSAAVMIWLSCTRRTLRRMNKAHTPVVPLEAGAGPDNPPCPACGEPLFGWIDERPGLAGPVSRCESCGLGVVGDPGTGEEALRELDRLRDEQAVNIAKCGRLSGWDRGAHPGGPRGPRP